MSCCFIKLPKITLVYCFPLNGAQGFCMHAYNFAQSYAKNPPGMEHDTLVICNGAPATQSSKDLFSPLPNVGYVDHDNSGWDIGAFQLAARISTSDLMVFCGSKSYFRKPNWLIRMWEVFGEFGDTLYGSTGNQGDMRFNVHPHVRTTGFWCTPKLLRDYPHRVTQSATGGERYMAEHGPNCLSNWVKQQGKQCWIAGFDSIWPLDQCDQMPGGFHNGIQYNVLVGDRLTMPPFYHTP
jgi:hypothetical protein